MKCKDCVHYELCQNLEMNGIGRIHPKQCDNFKDKARFVELPYIPIPMITNDGSDVFCPVCNQNLSGYYGEDSPNIITCFNCGAWLNNTKSITPKEAEEKLKELKE